MTGKSSNIIKSNSERWNILPAGNHRINITKLNKLGDFWLKLLYRYFAIKWKKERRWEHEKYSELFKDRDVLEVGGGLGYDGLVYSHQAKSYTFAELNEHQIGFLKRIMGIFQRNNVHFEWMEEPFSHPFKQNFQGFYAHGVLHHVPFETARKEFENIDKYLDPGAKVVMLMYPKERWEAAGEPSFEEFGNYTDGGCPWAEYYDSEKILALTGPGYTLLEEKKWGWKNIEFVNFDLIKN